MSTTRARGRYAPSPTGTLHLGNLRTAVLAWLCARHVAGAFILRMEDLDRPRVQPGAAARQMADLHWLGLDWDEGPDVGGALGPYMQSAREALYDAALSRLRERDLLYPCYCTRADLARTASAPHIGDDPPPYPGICRDLTGREKQRLEAAGRRPAWRFRVPKGVVGFYDTIAGNVSQDVQAAVGDFVVRRSDGMTAYQLAVVVDDALMGITQVVRGGDLLPSTPRQLTLYDALGYSRPAEYVHAPLALDPLGERMAKRDASAGISAARERKLRPEHVLGALAASVGIWPAGEPATPAQLLATFDPSRIRREPSLVVL